MAIEPATQRRETRRKWRSAFVLVSCSLPIVHLGYIYSIATIFTDVMSTFNSTRAETAVIHSTLIAVFLFSGLFTGALIKKIGSMIVGMLGCLLMSLALMVCFFASSITYLIICVGVLSAIGASFVYISSAAAVSQLFSGKKQLLYMSIHASGASIGGMIYPYIIRFLSDQYGFRGALLIIGAIGLNALPGCILWKQQSSASKRHARDVFAIQIEEYQINLQVRTRENGESITIERTREHPPSDEPNDVCVSQYPVLQDKAKVNTVTVVQNADHKSTSSNKRIADQTLLGNIKDILHNKVFIIFLSGMTIVTPTLTLIIIFVADIYRDNGLTNDDVSLGLLIINLMGVIGRLLIGLSLQNKCVSLLMLPTLNSVVAAVIIIVLIFVKTRWLIIVLTGAYGTALGALASMTTVVTLELVGTHLLPIAVGITFTLMSVFQVVAGPINGYIRDATGSYTAIFYVATGINLIGAVVFFVARITRRKAKKALQRQSAVFYLTSF